MKKLLAMLLTVAVFFIGLGAIAQETTAKFKSDERALALLAKARQAIGGEETVRNVRSMAITARTTHVFKIDGVERAEQGSMEIAMQLPNMLSKTIKIGDPKGGGNQQIVDKQVDVIVMRKAEGGAVSAHPANPDGQKKGVFKTDDGAEILVEGVDSAEAGNSIVVLKKDGKSLDLDGKKMIFEKDVNAVSSHGQTGHNQMLEMTLGLLASAPGEMPVEYLYAGESTVDGQACNVIEAKLGGKTIKLFLGRDSNLPVMTSFMGVKMPKVFKPSEADIQAMQGGQKVIIQKAGERETAEFQVRFSDFRSVNGLLLPHRWTQTVGGQPDETIEVTSYEINPANIAEKLKHVPQHKVMMRKAEKSDQN
jgi:hypothetical protein